MLTTESFEVRARMIVLRRIALRRRLQAETNAAHDSESARIVIQLRLKGL